MITKMNHVSVFVLNQDSAYEFYVNKLGFKVHTDAPMGRDMRWLTVCPPEQPDLEITLLAKLCIEVICIFGHIGDDHSSDTGQENPLQETPEDQLI